MQPPTIDDIRAATKRVDGAVIRTPMLVSRTLSEIIGAEVWLKFENLQFTAAYKERGALNKLLQLTSGERARGVIAASAVDGMSAAPAITPPVTARAMAIPTLASVFRMAALKVPCFRISNNPTMIRLGAGSVRGGMTCARQSISSSAAGMATARIL